MGVNSAGQPSRAPKTVARRFGFSTRHDRFFLKGFSNASDFPFDLSLCEGRFQDDRDMLWDQMSDLLKSKNRPIGKGVMSAPGVYFTDMQLTQSAPKFVEESCKPLSWNYRIAGRGQDRSKGMPRAVVQRRSPVPLRCARSAFACPYSRCAGAFQMLPMRSCGRSRRDEL